MSRKGFSIQHIILRSHLWLGICAAVCTWGTYKLLHQTVSYEYLGFVLAGTMTIYSFHGYFALKQNQKTAESSKVVPNYLKVTLAIGSVMTSIVFLFLDRNSQLLLLLPAFMAFVYVFPILGGKRLKDFPFIKIIAIVSAWTIITYLIPVHSISHWWEKPGYTLLLIDRLLFFFVLAIPFDIRDMSHDKEQALRTIPNTIGLQNRQFLALFSLFLAAGFMTMGCDLLGIDPPLRIGLLLVYFLTGLLIIRLKYIPTAGFYSWYMDGILFVYGIVILFLSE